MKIFDWGRKNLFSLWIYVSLINLVVNTVKRYVVTSNVPKELLEAFDGMVYWYDLGMPLALVAGALEFLSTLLWVFYLYEVYTALKDSKRVMRG